MKVYVFQSDKRSLDIPGDPPLRIENYLLSTTDERVAARARRQNQLTEITDIGLSQEEPAPKEKAQGQKKKIKVPAPPTIVHGMRQSKEKE